jgi:formylglycine-generating enzyme required for sulfatase activity
MSGNVWEWVDDWFSFYAKAKKKTRKEGMVFTEKILRGGSWYNTAYYINVGMRFKINPDIKLNSIGFRCAWDVQQ